MQYVASFFCFAFATLLVILGFVAELVLSLICGLLLCLVGVVILWRGAQSHKERLIFPHPPVRESARWSHDQSSRDTSTDGAVDNVVVPDVVIEDYDKLTTNETLISLETLSTEELHAVIAREKLGRRRTMVIQRAERLIDLTTNPEQVDALRIVAPTTIDEPVLPREATEQRSRRGIERRRSLNTLPNPPKPMSPQTPQRKSTEPDLGR